MTNLMPWLLLYQKHSFFQKLANLRYSTSFLNLANSTWTPCLATWLNSSTPPRKCERFPWKLYSKRLEWEKQNEKLWTAGAVPDQATIGFIWLTLFPEDHNCSHQLEWKLQTLHRQSRRKPPSLLWSVKGITGWSMSIVTVSNPQEWNIAKCWFKVLTLSSNDWSGTKETSVIAVILKS